MIFPWNWRSDIEERIRDENGAECFLESVLETITLTNKLIVERHHRAQFRWRDGTAISALHERLQRLLGNSARVGTGIQSGALGVDAPELCLRVQTKRHDLDFDGIEIEFVHARFPHRRFANDRIRKRLSVARHESSPLRAEIVALRNHVKDRIRIT